MNPVRVAERQIDVVVLPPRTAARQGLRSAQGVQLPRPGPFCRFCGHTEAVHNLPFRETRHQFSGQLSGDV